MMAAMLPLSTTLFLCFLFHISTADESCEWPKFFDISREEYNKPQEISWETEAIMDTEIIPSLGWFSSSKKYISILNNNTLEISKYKRKTKTDSTVFKCVKNYGNLTYMISNADKNEYMCIQLKQRSDYVVQWKKVPVDNENVICSEVHLGHVDPWPLIFLPLRHPAGDTTILSNHKYLVNYPSCPELGGFHLRVFDKDGNAVRCKNDNPSSSLDVECVHGEGIRIITGSGSCGVYGFGNKKQSKLHCLANWDEGEYTFSVLMPNDELGMHIFHCLRFNREDPTKENAILFLDTICDSSPGPKSTYFQLELRRKNYTSLCDDLSDQCSKDTCSRMKYWCAKTCNTCPNVTYPIMPADDIQGKWIMQRQGSHSFVEISDKNFTVLGMGTFQAYGPLGRGKDVCLRPPLPLWRESEEYALARLGDGEGCGPRVTQLRAKRISDAVLLLQVAGTAPMMPDSFMVYPRLWCKNNWRDSVWFAHIFRPHWPFGNHHSSPPNGFLSLINQEPEKQKPEKCLFDTHTLLGPHMEINVTFGEGDNKIMCNGESQVYGDSSWGLAFDCGPGGPATNISFDCLGGFMVNRKVRGIILKTRDEVSEDSGFALKDQFYCLLVASKEYHKDKEMFLTTAGECDDTLLTMFEWGALEPFVKMIIIGKVVIIDPASAAIRLTMGSFLLWASLLIRYVFL